MNGNHLVGRFPLERNQALVSRHHPLEEQVLFLEALAQLNIDHVIRQFLCRIVEAILRSLSHHDLSTFAFAFLLFLEGQHALEFCKLFGVLEPQWLVLFV